MTITAKIIADSINAFGIRITTFELVYPRMIHSELMTHRLFSRNAASSRAIPISAVIEQVRSNPATPSHWGKNQPGMQARVELEGIELDACKVIWNDAMLSAVMHAERMTGINAHKQVANRILEPFVHMKTVLTATEFNNWWWLRDHEDADPTIHELAEAMRVAYNESTPDKLNDGEWHMPYVSWVSDIYGTQIFQDENFNDISVEEALKISASCCAQVSYRKNDPSLAKAEDIYDKLVSMEPVHASPFEHSAKCSEYIATSQFNLPEGITHIDRYGNWWSGNMKQWIQHRQLIPNNVKHG